MDTIREDKLTHQKRVNANQLADLTFSQRQAIPVFKVSLNGHTESVTSIAELPDGRVVSGSCDKSLKVWSSPQTDKRIAVSKAWPWLRFLKMALRDKGSTIYQANLNADVINCIGSMGVSITETKRQTASDSYRPSGIWLYVASGERKK